MNLVGGSRVGHRPLKKGMKRSNKNNKVHHTGPSQTKKKRTDKNQAECFYCKKLGHLKSYYNTPDFFLFDNLK